MHDNDGKMTLEKICTLLDIMTDGLKSATNQGLNNLDTHEAGQVADIIKDLSEAKKNLTDAEKNEWESCYYASIVKAMKDADERGDEEDRYGYIPREASRMGKRGMQRDRIKRWVRDPDTFEDEMYERAGYTPGRKMSRDDRSSDNSSDERYGKPYREYIDSRRHYSESKSQADKDMMEMYANEHLMDVMGSVREIYKTADPDMRKRMKSDLTKLVGEMPT